MTTATRPAPLSSRLRRTRARALRSPLVDLLLGPHGVDRYLELIRPSLTVGEARAEITAVRRQSERSVTLTLRPNGAWEGFTAGQFVRAGFEIDGVRRTRTYSPAGSQYASALELTVTRHPGGVVSSHLLEAARPGQIVHLAPAQGGFTLPAELPERLVLVSGGSGITPVLSMLRTLIDGGHGGEITFVHYARRQADWLYRAEVQALAERGRVAVHYRVTRGSGAEPRLGKETLAELAGEPDGAAVAVCGPPLLLEAARAGWSALGGRPESLLVETFTPPRLTVGGDAAAGTLRFLRSQREAPIAAASLLEQAEAAGLEPAFGCRMGICHTCTCRKAAGAVRNLRTGEVSDEEDEDIQLCVSVPAGDVALEL